MNGIRKAHTQKSNLKDEDFSIILLFNWIGAVVSALLAKPDEAIFLKHPILEKPTDGEFHEKVNGDELLDDITRLSQHVAEKRKGGEADQEADLIDALLVELACLAMPEVGIINICTNTAIKKLLEGILKLEYLKKIDYRVRAKRLMRIGPHIGTELGYGFLSNPESTPPLFPEDSELKAHFLKWDRKGFDNKICKRSIELVREKIFFVSNKS